MNVENQQTFDTDNEDSEVQGHIKNAVEDYFQNQQMLKENNRLITNPENKNTLKKRSAAPKAGDYLKRYISSKQSADQIQQVNISSYNEIQELLFQIAEEVIEEDGGFLPGFSLRVRAYTLDEYFEKTGLRKAEHILAVDQAMRKFSRQRKNLTNY